jgi:hypothetical protein
VALCHARFVFVAATEVYADAGFTGVVAPLETAEA